MDFFSFCGAMVAHEMKLVSSELAKLYLHRIFFVRKLRIAALAFILKSGIPLTLPDISRGSFYTHTLVSFQNLNLILITKRAVMLLRRVKKIFMLQV